MNAGAEPVQSPRNTRFLIVKPSSLGDILHAFPAADALRRAYPGAVIDWVVNPAFEELLDYMPGIHRRIPFRRKELGKWNTFFPELFFLWKEIRENRYDAVIDLQGLMRSALVARFARASEYYGPDHVRESLAKLFYSRKLFFPADVFHAVERNCEMIRQIPGVTDVNPYFELPVLPGYKEKAERLLAEEGFTRGLETLWIAVAPGARWATKQWPPEFFAEVMRGIAERRSNVSFLLLGSSAEKEPARKLKESLGNGIEVLDLCGKTSLGELVELIRMTDLLICNDSGPMHIAASAGTKVLAFFGPTYPELTGPYCKVKKVFQPKLDCIKCFRKYCQNTLCHRSISAGEVIDSALELTGRSKNS